MNKITSFLFILFLTTFNAKSQLNMSQDTSQEIKIVVFANEPQNGPTYPNGFNSMVNQIYSNLLFSSDDKKEKAKVLMNIDEKGVITSITIKDGLTKNQEKNIKNSISKLQYFIPAENQKLEKIKSQIELTFPYYYNYPPQKDSNYIPLENNNFALIGNWEFKYSYDKHKKRKICNSDQLIDHFNLYLDSNSFNTALLCDVIFGTYKFEKNYISFNWDKSNNDAILCVDQCCIDPLYVRKQLKNKLKIELVDNKTINLYVNENIFYTFLKF